MSLINQMLQDLEQRRADGTSLAVEASQVRAVTGVPRVHVAWWLALALLTALLGLGLWSWLRAPQLGHAPAAVLASSLAAPAPAQPAPTAAPVAASIPQIDSGAAVAPVVTQAAAAAAPPPAAPAVVATAAPAAAVATQRCRSREQRQAARRRRFCLPPPARRRRRARRILPAPGRRHRVAHRRRLPKVSRAWLPRQRIARSRRSSSRRWPRKFAR